MASSELRALYKQVLILLYFYFFTFTFTSFSGCSGVVVEYQTRNREDAGSTHTKSTASNLEQATVCSGQLHLLPSAGWEMSSYG